MVSGYIIKLFFISFSASLPHCDVPEKTDLTLGSHRKITTISRVLLGVIDDYNHLNKEEEGNFWTGITGTQSNEESLWPRK